MSINMNNNFAHYDQPQHYNGIAPVVGNSNNNNNVGSYNNGANHHHHCTSNGNNNNQGIDGVIPKSYFLNMVSHATPQMYGSNITANNWHRRKLSCKSLTNLYITGLSENVNDEVIRQIINNVIVPKSCKALIVNGTGKCSGSGFIDCFNKEDAEKAKAFVEATYCMTEMSSNYTEGDVVKLENGSEHVVLGLNTILREGRRLEIDYAHEAEKDPFNVYVKNLPLETVTEASLQAFFSKFGCVTSCRLLVGGSASVRKQSGAGFVRFGNEGEAKHAIDMLIANPEVFPGSNTPLEVKLADKSDRRRHGSGGSNHNNNNNYHNGSNNGHSNPSGGMVAANNAAVYSGNQNPVAMNDLLVNAIRMMNINAQVSAAASVPGQSIAPQMTPLNGTPMSLGYPFYYVQQPYVYNQAAFTQGQPQAQQISTLPPGAASAQPFYPHQALQQNYTAFSNGTHPMLQSHQMIPTNNGITPNNTNNNNNGAASGNIMLPNGSPSGHHPIMGPQVQQQQQH